MFYVGLDIHAKHISICVLNEAGQYVHRTQLAKRQPDRGKTWNERVCAQSGQFLPFETSLKRLATVFEADLTFASTVGSIR